MEFTSMIDMLQTSVSLNHLSIGQVMSFITRASSVKLDIQLVQPAQSDHSVAPDVLPPSVAEFLSESVGIPLEHVQECWDLLKGVVWEMPTAQETKATE